MTATEFKLIPWSVLHRHEADVLRRLDEMPFCYATSLRDEPEIRYAFLHYALLTHWPELLNGDISAEDVLGNRLYWFLRWSEQRIRHDDLEPAFETQGADLLETATRELGAEAVDEITEKVRRELATNEREIAVSFGSFSIGKVKDELGVRLDESGDFFAKAPPVAVSTLLLGTLEESVSLALNINTEKARSEMIVTPVLLEVRRQLKGKVSLFSGVEWDVDAAQGLRGRCDFLMGLSPEQLRIEAPVLAIVEVKSDDVAAGIAQCLAEMVAARIFNRQRGVDVPTIFGAVTTGNLWKFLRLVETTAFVDVGEYHIKEIERIVGIILSMFQTI